jgi:hypothetical protein
VQCDNYFKRCGKKAGVSPKTVSRVVNREKDVSDGEGTKNEATTVDGAKIFPDIFFVIAVIANGNDNKVIIARLFLYDQARYSLS